MAYEEERIIAENVFGKSFDELSEEEKEAVHEFVEELRKKEQLKGTV
jgi:predicted Ser/Thr protein kinase